MKYLIHSCPERLWYVQGYLIPSMLKQGIDIKSIQVWNDSDHKGCLFSTMDSFRSLSNNEYGTWHLQDDVLISSQFKQKTEYPKFSIVSGYCSKYIVNRPPGVTNLWNMWYSFPCIYIKNRYAKECADWFYSEAVNDSKYQDWVESKKYDDEFFKIFMRQNYPHLIIYQENPNLVEHVDWLIGGSVLSPEKKEQRTSRHWVEPELVDELRRQLEENNEYAKI